MGPLPHPLARWLAELFHMERVGRHWADDIRSMFATQTEDNGLLLRSQFADALLHATLTPEQFAALTHDTLCQAPGRAGTPTPRAMGEDLAGAEPGRLCQPPDEPEAWPRSGMSGPHGPGPSQAIANKRTRHPSIAPLDKLWRYLAR